MHAGLIFQTAQCKARLQLESHCPIPWVKCGSVIERRVREAANYDHKAPSLDAGAITWYLSEYSVIRVCGRCVRLGVSYTKRLFELLQHMRRSE